MSVTNCQRRLAAKKTLDLWFHKIKGHQWMMGSLIFVTSYFLQILLTGSLLSTLDSLLFCIFILHPNLPFCKMGCSIKESAKVWRNSGFTDGLGCGMMTMLGGFRKEVAQFIFLKDSQCERKTPNSFQNSVLVEISGIEPLTS